MRVLITGSRTWTKKGPIQALMLGLFDGWGAEFVFGDCPTGVDAIALRLCQDYQWAFQRFEADWNQYGKAAGPRRNGEMVNYCKEDPTGTYICYGIRAEGHSPGTDNCLGQAYAAGIPCYVIKPLTYSPSAPGTKGHRYNSATEGP